MLKLKNLLFIFFIFLSSLILLYVIYKSEIIYDGNNRNYYKKYFIFIIIFILLNLFFIILNNQIKTYLNICFISILFAFYSFEFYSVFIKKSKKEIFYYKKNGIKYDNRTTIQYYKDLKKIYNNVVIKIGGYNFLTDNNLDIFPISGISNSLTVNCNENGYFSTYNSDRYGFNNQRDFLWDEKNIDLLVVGDSFTQGACVNFKDEIVGNLEKIGNYRILNLSVTGNGPLIQYASLKEYAEDLQIKKILWFFSEGNDLFNLDNELNNFYLSQYFVNKKFSQNLKKKQSTINTIVQNKINYQEKIEPDERKFIRFLKLDTVRNLLLKEKKNIYGLGSFNDFEITKYNTLIKKFKKILNLTLEFSKKKNSDFFFIYMPEYSRYQKNYKHYKMKNDIKKIVEELNINFIDIDDLVFKKHKKPLSLFPFESFFHYNELGYRYVSIAVNNFIINHQNKKIKNDNN